MRRTEQLQGLRMLKLRDVLSGWEAGRLIQLEAAEVLGMSERTFRRWSKRFEEDGEDGLCDRRLGRRSGRAVPDEDADEVERLYRERYAGFTVKHFHEHQDGRVDRAAGIVHGDHQIEAAMASSQACDEAS
ncbi:hypothetical protein BH23BAC4_BH23BAC4_02030 [soil metagenome]